MRAGFERKLSDESVCLFVYGVSFDKNDDHIFEAVRNSKVKSIYISTREAPADALRDKVALIKASRARARARARAPQIQELTVRFFDAASARPWGD